jgi:hypothetical protein
MILENAKPRLNEAIDKANSTKEIQEVTFIYNELLTYDTITSVFDWIFRQNVDFGTRHDEYRFVILIHPKN